MVGGLPSYRQTMSSNEKPATPLAPASAKVKPNEAEKDTDTASMVSTTTYSSTVSLLKSRLHDHKARKEAKKQAVKEKKKTIPKDPMSRKSPADWNARARTAEAYMVQAILR